MGACLTTNFDTSNPLINSTVPASATMAWTVRSLPVESLTQSAVVSDQNHEWPSWLPEIYGSVRSWIDDGEHVEPRSVIRLLHFLRTLRRSTARPFVALGDDGSGA